MVKCKDCNGPLSDHVCSKYPVQHKEMQGMAEDVPVDLCLHCGATYPKGSGLRKIAEAKLALADKRIDELEDTLLDINILVNKGLK